MVERFPSPYEAEDKVWKFLTLSLTAAAAVGALTVIAAR